MIPRTLFSSEHELFRESVRTFLEKHAVPFHGQWEKQGYIDRNLWNQAGEAGMLCSHLPEEYGGLGADFLQRGGDRRGQPPGFDRHRLFPAFGYRRAVHPALRQ